MPEHVADVDLPRLPTDTPSAACPGTLKKSARAQPDHWQPSARSRPLAPSQHRLRIAIAGDFPKGAASGCSDSTLPCTADKPQRKTQPGLRRAGRRLADLFASTDGLLDDSVCRNIRVAADVKCHQEHERGDGEPRGEATVSRSSSDIRGDDKGKSPASRHICRATIRRLKG